MNIQKTAFLIVLGVLSIIGILILGIESKTPPVRAVDSSSVKIDKKWELPEILNEISGIAYMGNNRVACVQDENGIIFIYDLTSSTIEKQVEFAGAGDYEAITLAGKTAYVLRSDGTIFEVSNFKESSPITTTHSTPLKGKLNFEGLGYDKRNNRLLIALKEKASEEYIPVFSFNLINDRWGKEPVFKIDVLDPVFGILDQKISRKILRPSEISVHPTTEKIYVLEGLNPIFLVMDSTGKPEELHILNIKQFPQAEGLTFGESGEIYISNEGSGAAANIIQISMIK